MLQQTPKPDLTHVQHLILAHLARAQRRHPYGWDGVTRYKNIAWRPTGEFHTMWHHRTVRRTGEMGLPFISLEAYEYQSPILRPVDMHRTKQQRMWHRIAKGLPPNP